MGEESVRPVTFFTQDEATMTTARSWQKLAEALRVWRRGVLILVALACCPLGLWGVELFRRHRTEQATARQQAAAGQLASLRQAAEASDSDAAEVARRFQQFRATYPEWAASEEVAPLQALVQAHAAEQHERQAQVAHDEFLRAADREVPPPDLLAMADRFLAAYAGSPLAGDVRRRRAAIALRYEERAIEPAREFSTRQPLEFAARRERYQSYLERYPNGNFVAEANAALRAIAADWDRHDFRAVRDLYVARPGATADLVPRCRAYLATHPEGRFTGAARDLLRWTERVTTPGEYKVTLRCGQFDRNLARFFSRGPDLSVELEVNGVRHGPSQIVKNRYDPEWNYEFPRRLNWKLGDPICVRITDHDWKDRTMLEIFSENGDPLAIKLVSGEVWAGKSWLRFESDFTLPVLPAIE